MIGYLGNETPGHKDYNPYSATSCLLTVESTSERSWILDANHLMCELVGWQRGNFGDPRDPNCQTQTLIGKPLDVLIPPIFRRSHHLFQRAFAINPLPRTMGEGRNTPIWIKGKDVHVDGLSSITGRQLTVLIGLSPLKEDCVLAIVQPMEVIRQLILPEIRNFPLD